MGTDGEVVTPKSILVRGVVVVNSKFTDSDIGLVISYSIEQRSEL